MERSRHQGRDGLKFHPRAEQVEGRVMLSQAGALGSHGFLNSPPGFHVVRPNTPVVPFGAPLATATFIDTSVRVLNGNHTVIGQKSYVGPYATLDSRSGFIKIGSQSEVLDNATIISTPQANRPNVTSVLIGDLTSIGYGATVIGQTTIGAYGTSAKPTGIGANAVINGATIEPGAVVGPLAQVGPGVTVPSGYYILPGANITSQAQITNPVATEVSKTVPAAVLADLEAGLTRGSQLASGYTNLYQGSTATGASPGVLASVTGINQGNLAAVSGMSNEPGPSTTTATTGITFEPKAAGPTVIGPFLPSVTANLYNFPARITGDVRFKATPRQVASEIGRSNAIRGDQGQPITFNSAPITGRGVTINSPLGGTTTSGTTTKTVGGITFGTNFTASSGAVILGGAGASYTFGDNVSVGQNAVIANSSIGTGVSIGAKSYISGSTIAAGTTVPAGTIIVNNKYVGQVEW